MRQINHAVAKDGVDVAFFTHESDARLFAAAPKMLAMLRRLEWAGHDSDGESACIDCEHLKINGHAPDCELAALLANGGPTDAK